MTALTPVEYNNQRILTTQQLANGYGADTRAISNNFNRNKDRYIPGKHYYFLDGDALAEFKADHQIDDQLKYATSLYLWTEKGALLHAKSLNTDRAWEVYDELVENYFRPKLPQQITGVPQTYLEALKALVASEEEKQLALAELDRSKEWYSIKRVASMNGVSHKRFNWRDLKAESERRNLGPKKIFDANYGEVNTYHMSIWESVYPEYEL